MSERDSVNFAAGPVPWLAQLQDDEAWRRMALGQVLPLHFDEAESIPARVAASGRDLIDMDTLPELEDARPLLRPVGMPDVPERLAHLGRPLSMDGGPEIKVFADRGRDSAVYEAPAGWPDDMLWTPLDTQRLPQSQDSEEPDIGPGFEAAMGMTGREPRPGFQAGRHDDATGGPMLAALLTAFDAHQHQEDRKITAAMQAELVAMQTGLNTVQAELAAMQPTLTMQVEYEAPPDTDGPATRPNRHDWMRLVMWFLEFEEALVDDADSSEEITRHSSYRLPPSAMPVSRDEDSKFADADLVTMVGLADAPFAELLALTSLYRRAERRGQRSGRGVRAQRRSRRAVQRAVRRFRKRHSQYPLLGQGQRRELHE